MISILADLFLVIGAAFIAIGSLGLIRMPDVYNRLQAGTKSATLGALTLLLGIGLHYPDWWPKLLVIVGFIMFTNPVGSSTIARAARSAGIPFWSKEEGYKEGGPKEEGSKEEGSKEEGDSTVEGSADANHKQTGDA